jgi:hypothetical protein
VYVAGAEHRNYINVGVELLANGIEKIFVEIFVQIEGLRILNAIARREAIVCYTTKTRDNVSE